MFRHQLAFRVGLLSCLSAGMVLPSAASLANPIPTEGVNTTVLPAELPRGKQNTRPVPPTDPETEPVVTYTQQELAQFILVLREIQRQQLRPQQTAQIESLLRELEQLQARGETQVVLTAQQGRQLQAVLSSLTREEIERIEAAIDLQEVRVGVFTQPEIEEILSILNGIQELGLRPQQTQDIAALIREFEQLQAQEQPEAILSPENTQLLRTILDSLTPTERAQIEEAVGVELAQGVRVNADALQDLVSFLNAVQRLRLRPQQTQEIRRLIGELEDLQAKGEPVAILSERQAEQVQNLIESLTPEELAQLEQELPSNVSTPRQFTQAEVEELLQVLEAARDLDLTPEQAQQVEELTEIFQTRQATGEEVVILSVDEVETLLTLVNSLNQKQLRRIARALGQAGAFPAISINNPTGFGGGWGNIGIGGLFNQRNRFTRSSDGAISAVVGFGDPEEAIGLDATLAITGLSNDQGQDDNFGAGSISLQASRLLPNNFSVAVGVTNLVDWDGAADDTGRSFYATASKVLVFDEENINQPFGLGFVTLGVGNGVFRTEDNIDPEDELGGSEFNVFGSFATRMGPQATAIAEWTGQDLTLGLSVVPFKRVPLVTSFGLNDLTGNSGDGVRLNFSIVYGISF